jgi:TPR repeat protein
MHQALLIVAGAVWLVGTLVVSAISVKRRKLPIASAFNIPGSLKNFAWFEWILFLGVTGASLVLVWHATAEDTAPQTAANGCPGDTRLCPDGSYVSRAGPLCAFMPCAGGGTISDLYGTRDATPADANTQSGSETPMTPKEEIRADSQPDESFEKEPVLPKDVADQIDVEACSKGERAGYMRNGHPTTFSAMATKNNLCIVKVIQYTEEGGSSYTCEFRMRGLPEQGFEKYFKIATFDSIKDKSCAEDYSEVLTLNRLAASRGNAQAQYNVAKYYDQEHGITEDFPEAAKWYRKAAEQGHAGAEYSLGVFYQRGLGVAPNVGEAAKWYRKAADQNVPEAEYALGALYDRGLGTTPDPKEAAGWYNKAAIQGYPDAQAALGDLFAAGRGVAQSYDNAYFWYIVAAESNIKDYVTKRDQTAREVTPGKGPEIQHRAAAWHPQGTATAVPQPPPAPAPAPPPTPKPPSPAPAPAPAPVAPKPVVHTPAPVPAPPTPQAEAAKPLPKDLPSLEALANTGDAAAQYAMAQHYSSGNPLNDDMERAGEWYLKAAQQGNPKAEYAIGVLYEQGRGMKKNEEEAAKWYRKAADAGIPSAQYLLGMMYREGRGVKQDDTEASKWISEAAEVGVVGAQFQMGLLYMAGKGVEKSNSEAFDMFKRAAEQGNDDAQYSVATMLLEGSEDVPKDLPNAYFWLCLASNSHNAGENLRRAELRDKLEKQLPWKVAQALKKSANTWKPTPENIKY